MDNSPTIDGIAIPVVEKPLLSKKVLIIGIGIFIFQFAAALVTSVLYGLVAYAPSGLEFLLAISGTGLSFSSFSIGLLTVVYTAFIIDDLRHAGIGKPWMHLVYLGLAILSPAIGFLSIGVRTLMVLLGGTIAQLTLAAGIGNVINIIVSCILILGTVGVSIFMIRYRIRGAYRMFAVAGINLLYLLLVVFVPPLTHGFAQLFAVSLIGLATGTLSAVLRVSILLHLTKRGRTIPLDSAPSV